MPPPVVQTKPTTPARHPLTAEERGFLRLPNMPADRTPVRVGVLLPFSNGQPATRALAKGMMNAAELALFDAHNPDILLMTGDEGSTPSEAASAARELLSEGAEVLVGPVFAASVSAVAPIARDRGIPVIGFSTDRAVAGHGVYLLSYQPGSEVRRIISYAASRGRTNIAALIPRTAYGDRVEEAFKQEAEADKLHIATIQRFNPGVSDFSPEARAIAASGADTVLIGQGGAQLSLIAAALNASGAHPQLLGTGLWADKGLDRAAVAGGWFAAPPPRADAEFDSKYRAVFNTSAPQLAPLAYDAVSLTAALAPGQPYHRFTEAALTDADGFSGVSGIFRFNPDGSADRGLAVMSVGEDDVHVIDPAPRTFQVPHA
ncbi:MAG TPA: penicillin-binding protein activator [Rhizomicrobium sp.]